MTILIVHCELNRSDAKSHKSRLTVLAKEIQKGRRSEQISSNGCIFFIQTPESADAFAARLIKHSVMSEENDRLAVINVSQGRTYIWGNFDTELKSKFPFVVEYLSI